MKKLISIGPIAIMFAAFLWSMDGLLRRSLYVLPPLVVVFYEHTFGFAILLPFVISHFKKIFDIPKKTWGAFIWITLLSSIAGTLFYTAALGKIQYIQFSVVVLLQQLQPAFEVLFGYILLKETIHKRFIPWFIASLFGAYLVAFPNMVINVTTGQGTIIAALFAIGAAFSWGSSTAFSRFTLLQMPSQLATAIRFGLASLFTLIIILSTGQGSALYAINETQLLFLVIISLSTGMVALSIYYYGMKRTPVWVSSICELTWPASAILMDYFIYHKTLTITQWIGTIIIIAGIYNISKHHAKDSATGATLLPE